MIHMYQEHPGLSSSDQGGLRILGLFSNPVQVSQGDDVYKFTEEELHLLKNQEFTNNVSNLIGVRTDILDYLKLDNLKKYIEKYVNFYANSVIGLPKDLNIKITTSWINKTLNGQENHNHSHGNSILSGVLTLTPNNILNFYSPNSRLHIFAQSLAVNYKDHLDQVFQCEFKSVGSLAIFPSGLIHGVPQYCGEDPRYSLAFNTMIYGVIGSGVNQLILS